MTSGRKHHLFAGSDEGGRRTAILYTLVGTVLLYSIDPQAWLTDLIADHTTKRLDDLMPCAWTSNLPQQSKAP